MRSGDRFNSPWRVLATALYAPPSEGRIYGTLELDARAALDWIEARRGNGVQLTLTHLMVAALGRALARDVPELNCLVRRGRVVARERVDVGVTVDAPGERGVAAVVVRDADRIPLAEIASRVRGEARRERAGEVAGINRSRDPLAGIPWPLRRPAVRLASFAVHELGLELPSRGLTRDAFGSILLSNIGTFGLATGMLALFPLARLPAAIAMGRIEERAVVRGGEIVVRPVLPLTGTFDHRLVDGQQAGRLAQAVRGYFEKPESLETG